MANIIIDIFCMLIMAVLLLGINLQKDPADRTAKAFRLLIYAMGLFLLVNLFSDYLEGNASAEAALYVTNLIAFVAVDILIIAFAGYLYTFISNRGKKAINEIRLVVGICLIRIAVTLVLALTGNLFSIEKGVYVEESMYIIPYFITALEMLMLVAIIIKNRDSLKKREMVVMLIYLLFPVVPIIIEVYTDIYFLTPMALTVAILMVYVLIQAVALEKGKDRENLLEEISSTDLLTQLNNRRAYYNYIAQIQGEQLVGVIFCDMNGLKYTNDHYGHATGDELIKTFAGLLTKSFRADSVFRISGDEFVVILTDIPEDIFDGRFDDFRKTIAANNSIAASGSAFGKGCCMEQLAAEAEEKMYDDKRVYYSQSKKERGRSRD